jgi:phosphinothricin acetyltransferase
MHPAFRLTGETSVYVASAITGRGVGSALYNELFAILSGQGLHRVVVGIALPNDRSLRLHSKFGFRPVGIFSEYAVKHGLFMSSQWMERAL